MMLAVSLASQSHAYVVLNPVADTSFEWGLNDNNYGTNDSLHLRQYTSNNREYFTYIRFDISSITNPITDATFRVQQKSGATINSGRVRVLGLDNLAGNTPQNWGEITIKPSTLGAEFMAPTGTFTNGLSPFYTNRVTSFDDGVAGITEEITSDAATLEIVKVSGQTLVGWLENRRTNGGLATLIVDIPGAQAVEYYLHSRETLTNGAAPELQIRTDKVVKIWPVGDSVTYGANVAGGYRETLFTNLAARSYPIKLIGTSTGNSTTALSTADQAHHDGHSGYSITNAVNIDDASARAGIYEGVESWHSSIDTPDVILLMIGINDLNTGYKVDTAADRLNLLVDRLFGYYPNTRILVASLPDAQQVNSYRHGATNNIAVAVSNYNTGMLSVVAAQRALGRKIERVDMHSKLTLADLADGLHPNAAGYVKMGNVWADAVVEEPAVNATRVRVFLQGGQSNADGRAGATGQPSHPDIDFYYNVDHIHDVGVVERLTTLFPGASRDRNLGPEITFGRRLADILGCDTNNTRLAIIKHAEGGTSLYANWKAGGNSTTNGDGDQYLIFQKTVANGMTALTNKYPNAQITIEGMIWMQGETDADIGKGAEYFGNLTNFIADVRATIQPNLPFVIGRLSNNQSNWFVRVNGSATQLGLLQASQDTVAAGDPKVGIFNTDDLDVNPPNDDIHFNTASQLELGERFAYETAYLLGATAQLTPAPSNLMAIAGDGQVALSWNAASNATGYNVKRSYISGGPYTTIATGLTAVSYTNTGLANGTLYHYVVSSTNSSWGLESTNSAQVSVNPNWTTSPNIVERIYALTTDNQLIAFDSIAPGNILSAYTVSGLQANEKIVGMDFWNGTLYGLGDQSHLYTINRNNGAAGLVGTFTPVMNGEAFGFDAEPGGLRLVSNLDQDLLLDYVTGAATTNATLNGSPNPAITGLAYHPGNGQRYVADYSQNTIGLLNTSSGLVSTIGAAGIDFSRHNGFDISANPGNAAYLASPAASSGAAANLYKVDLTSGAASLVGLVGLPGDDTLIRGLAVGPGYVNLDPTSLITSANGNQLTLSWPQDHIGWRLESQTNSLSTGLGNNWVTVPDSAGTNMMVLALGGGGSIGIFYRLVYP